MFSVIVEVNALKALAICAGLDATRGMLTSVCVDTTTEGRTHLVTTDGHRMLIVGNATTEGDVVPGRYLLPLFDVKAVKQAGTPRYPQPAVICIDPDPRHTEVTKGGKFSIKGKSIVSGELLHGWQYPEWSRVIPRETSGKLAHFNFGYVGDFQRIGELLGREFPVIRHNGDGAALIDLGANALGILMPIRKGGEHGPLPEWLDPVTAERKAA